MQNKPDLTSLPTKQLKLWFYYEGKERYDKIKALTDSFSKSHTNITVTPYYVPFDQFKKRLSTGIASNDLPDLVITDSADHAAYAAIGIFADITDQLKAIPGIDQFYEGPMNSVTYNGKMYGLPFSINNLVLFYNTDMLVKAGLKPPQSWDELRSTAMALSVGDTKGFAISALQNEEGTFQYLPWLFSAGGSIHDMDSPQSIRSLSFLTNLIKDGTMSKEVINWTQADVMKQFSSGKVAMMINGPWQIPEIKSMAPDLNYGVALIPKDKQFASVLGGENLAVIKGENSGEAITFLTYFADPNVMNNFEKDFGYFPPRKDVASDPLWTKDPLLQIFSEEMQYASPRPASPQWPGISKAISAALVKSLSQYADPIENAKEAQAIIDQLLK